MIEHHSTPPEESRGPLLSPKIQNRVLTGTVVLLLMGAAFVAGRYSVQKKINPSDAFSQIPTPPAMVPSAPVPESALTMIDFTDVSEEKKSQVLSEFNLQTCGCSCKMSIAACIIKDPNCPFWKDHVNQIQKALGNGKKPKIPRTTKNMFSAPSGNINALTFPQGVGK